MSETAEGLRRTIDRAGELQSVVRTMKAVAGSSIGQYERAMSSLESYHRTVELALAAAFQQLPPAPAVTGRAPAHTGAVVAIVFGSDQGLVGQFNDVLVDFAVSTLQAMPGGKRLWSVGERIQSRLSESSFSLSKHFALPQSMNAITRLVSQILVAIEAAREKGDIAQVLLFHNQPTAGEVYTPMMRQLLPLDAVWQSNIAAIAWPTANRPEVMHQGEATLRAFVREYLFIALFRTCAESLVSENASRLAAMQRAEKNIDDMLEDLNRAFHRLRQNSIDEELFDVIAGFEGGFDAPSRNGPAPPADVAAGQRG